MMILYFEPYVSIIYNRHLVPVATKMSHPKSAGDAEKVEEEHENVNVRNPSDTSAMTATLLQGRSPAGSLNNLFPSIVLCLKSLI